MPLGHMTKTGNVSIPKKWRDELGMEPNSSILIEKTGDKIVLRPLKGSFDKIDEEIRRKKIRFTRKEAVKDDLYD